MQHIQFKTDQGEIKGRVKEVRGRAVTVTPHARFAATAKITSVVTVGKEDLTGAETSRADLILDAFKGGDALLTSPFVRKIFFPDYDLRTLKWPRLPMTQPKIGFTHRPLNASQRRAVEKCLSNQEQDRHVVVIVSSARSSVLPQLTTGVSGSTRDRQNHRNRSSRSKLGLGAQIEHDLDHRPIECRGQERCGKTGRVRFPGF